MVILEPHLMCWRGTAATHHAAALRDARDMFQAMRAVVRYAKIGREEIIRENHYGVDKFRSMPISAKRS